MFCVKCGKEGRGVINGLCVDCFLDGRQLVTLPHHVDLERCTNCEEFFINGQWRNIDQKIAIDDCALSGLAAIPEATVASVGTAMKELDARNFMVMAQVDVDIDGSISTCEVSTTVRLKNTVCKRCSRQLGNYYESTMQIRADGKQLSDEMRDEIVRRVRSDVENMAKNNRSLFITKVEEVHGGVDILLSSISIGRMLARDVTDAYGGEYKESFKLVGKTDDGTDMYRVTYLIRLPNYSVGDIVKVNDIPYKLIWIGKNGGKITDLRNFRETTIRRSDMGSIRVLLNNSDLKEATVVSTSPGEIQILHPSNYSTIDLRVPADASIGETVKVAMIDDDLYYVP